MAAIYQRKIYVARFLDESFIMETLATLQVYQTLIGGLSVFLLRHRLLQRATEVVCTCPVHSV